VPLIDGVLVAPEVLVGGCDGIGDVPVAGGTFAFDGPLSDELLQIPVGTHCGLFFVVDGFTLRLDEGAAEPTTVIADDFDLWVRTRFASEAHSRHTVVFGDEAWLAGVAAAAERGEIEVSGSNPALDEAFFAGLERSAVDTAEDPAEELEGRVDIGTWPTSPRGTPTTFPGCDVGVNFDLAVPIPPAAMDAAGLSDGEVGWCEANVLFADDLAVRTAVQTDWSDHSAYEVPYNGWSQGCGELHCGSLYDAAGAPLDRPCSALALCEGATARVTGFGW
jgi:hypothetical protein